MDFKIDFEKYPDGLVPAIIQDNITGKVLMLGYMNEASLKKTLQSKKVWFFSRSKNRLWLKGETSKNFLFRRESTAKIGGSFIIKNPFNLADRT
jgi:phosphoribosyl-ATP pyrophosphohydrolase/phosphoribosyl-AMP cyclohydrolase